MYMYVCMHVCMFVCMYVSRVIYVTIGRDYTYNTNYFNDISLTDVNINTEPYYFKYDRKLVEVDVPYVSCGMHVCMCMYVCVYNPNHNSIHNSNGCVILRR